MAIFFYGFAILMIISSLFVIASRNPVHSVLWLIFTFCNAAGLFVLMGAEFLAMMLIIIYVGAIAVLFLFVVMMLDIKESVIKNIIGSELSFAFFIALLLFVDLSVVIMLSSKIIIPVENGAFMISPEIGNSYAIGNVLYTNFLLPFQVSGIILFVAMVASITLTMRLRTGVKRQKVSEQNKRSKENTLLFAKIDSKNGLNNLNYDD
jgi:NADH-quinone oxidoreductase subunit J